MQKAAQVRLFAWGFVLYFDWLKEPKINFRHRFGLFLMLV
jgi:hypothetical protein